MPILINPLRWLTQPRGPLALDLSHPLLSGLLEFHDFTKPTAYSVKNRDAWDTGATLAALGGVQTTYRGTGVNWSRTPQWDRAALGSSFSSILLYAPVTTAAPASSFVLGDVQTTGGEGYNWGHYYAASTDVASFYVRNSSGTGVGAVGGAFVRDRPRIYVGSFNGASVSLDQYGTRYSSSLSGTVGTTSANHSLASNRWSIALAQDAHYVYHFLVARAYSGEMSRELDRNPWQIFRPLPRRIWVPVAGGGVSVTVTGTGKALTLGKGTATVLATAYQVVSGTGKALALTGGAATVTATAHQVVTGTGRSLTLTGGTATIEGAATVVLAGTGRALVLTGGTATVTAQTNVTLPGTGRALTLTGGTATPQYTARAFVTGTGRILSLVGGTATIDAPVSIVLEGSGGALVLRGGTASITSAKPEEVATGGWAAAFAREQRAARERDERREREAEEADLAREIAALEQHLAEQGVSQETESVSRGTDLARLRALADQLQAPANRVMRAISYAERAKTEAAIALAMREAQKALEEEELAILLILAVA